MLLPVVRRSSKADILVQLKDLKNQKIVYVIAHCLLNSKNKICPSFRPQLLDVIAAAQTDDSFDAAVEFINFQSQDITLAERYLQAVSLSTRPTEHLLDGNILHIFFATIFYSIERTSGLFKLSKKIFTRPLSESALLSLAAVTKTYAANPDKASTPVCFHFISDISIELD